MSLWFHMTAAGRLLTRRKGPVLRMTLVALIGTLWCIVGGVWTIATYRSIERQAETIQVDVFLRPSATDREARVLTRTVAALPAVDQARLVREQESWREFSSEIDVDEALRAVVTMPRIVRFWPNARHATVAELDALAGNLEKAYGDRIDQIVWSRALAEVVEARRRDLLVLGTVAGALSVVMFLLALVYAFRAEIHVAGGDLRVGALLGARASWVAMPHLLVSVMSGLLGLLLALALAVVGARYAPEFIPWVGVVRTEELGAIAGTLAVLGFIVCWWQSMAAGRTAIRKGA